MLTFESVRANTKLTHRLSCVATRAPLGSILASDSSNRSAVLRALDGDVAPRHRRLVSISLYSLAMTEVHFQTAVKTRPLEGKLNSHSP